MKLGIYIHIPFCRIKCDYCSFYSIPVAHLADEERDSIISRYINRILEEIDGRARSSHQDCVDTIYFGGGTPSIIDPKDIKRIVDKIESGFSVDKDAEITLECNPEDFSIERICEFRGVGINRIALGIQTLDEGLRGTIGRRANLCSVKLLDDFFSIEGIIHCVDIIIGIQGQTESSLLGELDIICAYAPEHISAYLLSVEKGTALYDRFKPVSEFDESQVALFKTTMDKLKGRGYRHYEVSNYSIPGYESRHNMKYWRFLPYLGFGAGAHSFYSGERYYNSMSVMEYNNSKEFHLARDARSKNSEMAEYILTSMRLLDGMSLKDFENKLAVPIPDKVYNRLIEMRDNGYLDMKVTGDHEIFSLTDKGLFLMDSIIYDITEPIL
jgi:oxygen-independent coproporphyrinogen III oxidase